MNVECCLCGKTCSDLCYTVPLSDNLQNYRLCVNCYDILKTLKNSNDIDKWEKANSYVQNHIGKAANDVQDYINKNNYKKQELSKSSIRLANEMMLTTGYSFDGYHITKYHDIIFKESFVGLGASTSLKSISDVVSSVTGSELSVVSERLQEIKLWLKKKVILMAVELGANALIGVDFESSIANNNAFLVSMTATAVSIEAD